MRRYIITLLLLLPLAVYSRETKLSNLLGDNMVLQQQTDARFWGTAEPGSKITAQVSWSVSEVTAKTDRNGNWELFVATPAATFEPQWVKINDSNSTIQLNNVLIGEVWLCSGQSNMEMQLSGFSASPVEGSLEEIAFSSQYKGVRYLAVKKSASVKPAADAEGVWMECNPLTSPTFGAVAYFFASRLSKALNVPVGIINASWGGSVIEAWLNEEYLQTCEDIDLADASNSSINDMYKPMVMYNGMFKPASKYSVNGIIWYQGESNISIAREYYADRLTAMAELWRSDIGRGDIPFFIIELAPYDYYDGQYGLQDENGPRLREQQFLATKTIPNSAIIGTNDLAYPHEAPNVHPSKKREIGERCCYMAMNMAYGYPTVQAKNPSFASMTIDKDVVTVRFDNASTGFIAYDDIVGFEIAGEGKHWHKADVKFGWGGTVQLSSREVPNPVAVRYCFHDFMIGNLKSIAGLPVIPFRTDNWDN